MEECTEGESLTARNSWKMEKRWFKRWFESLPLAFTRLANQISRVKSCDMRNDQKYPLLALPRIPGYVKGSNAERIAFIILSVSAVGWFCSSEQPPGRTRHLYWYSSFCHSQKTCQLNTHAEGSVLSPDEAQAWLQPHDRVFTSAKSPINEIASKLHHPAMSTTTAGGQVPSTLSAW